MTLEPLQQAWDRAAKDDALWAVLSQGGKHQDPETFFATGVEEIDAVMTYLFGRGVHPARRRALDFGCGPGRLTQALVRYFAQVDGIDISAGMIQLANRFNRAGKRCRYHVNTREDLAIFPDTSVDFVYSNITLQHMEPESARRYLKEFFRVLTPEGVAVFQIPGRQTTVRRWLKRILPASLLARYRRARYHGHPAASMHGIPRSEVIRLCAENGAPVVDIQRNHEAGPGWESFRYCCRKIPERAS